jgi:anti-sigma28 factor (negative regulator of flagellin synthesis)
MSLCTDDLSSSGSYPPDEPTLAARILSLLDHIRALDRSMDQARVEKLLKIKKALADGTYHVSAAEVARKIIDHMQEP